jgi:transcriptional regulator with XRE-family HTH domain
MSDSPEQVLDYIGANVQRIRIARDMTQEELATAAVVSTGFIKKVERGRTNIGVIALVQIANSLGVSPASLFRKAELPEAKRGRPRKAPKV